MLPLSDGLPAAARVRGPPLLAERVALVCAARTGIGDGVLAGLPALEIRGLSDGDARPLLLDSVHGTCARCSPSSA